MSRPKIKTLPDKASPNYLDAVIQNVIEAYKFFQSDSMALDYCSIRGPLRSTVLAHSDYKTQTRYIRAEKYLEEIEEVQQLTKDLRGTEPSDVDFRDSRDPDKEYQRQYKDWFAMRLKTAEMRRELLSLSRKDDESEEASALNIYFVPISREEFEQLKNVEIVDGTQDSSEAFTEEDASAPVAARDVLVEIKDGQAKGGFKYNADDSVEDW